MKTHQELTSVQYLIVFCAEYPLTMSEHHPVNQRTDEHPVERETTLCCEQFMPTASSSNGANYKDGQVTELARRMGSRLSLIDICEGGTPLCAAAYKGHVEMTRWLVKVGANVNLGHAETRATPLYVAAQEGHTEVVRFLVQSGADVNLCRTDTEATPLYMAAQEGHLDIVQILVDAVTGVNHNDSGDSENAVLCEGSLRDQPEVSPTTTGTGVHASPMSDGKSSATKETVHSLLGAAVLFAPEA